MRITLRIRTITYFITATVIPTLVIGYVVTTKRLSDERKDARDALTRQASDTAEHVHDHLTLATSILERSATREPVRAFAAAGRIDPPIKGIPENADPELRAILRSIKAGGTFEYAFLANHLGDIYALEPYSLQAKESSSNYSYRKWFQDVRARGETTVSELFISPVTNRPTVYIVTPVSLGGTKLTGVLGAALQLDGLAGMIARENAANAATGINTFLVGRCGSPIASGSNGCTQAELLSRDAVILALMGERGSKEEDHHRQKYLVAYCPVQTSGAGWAVITEQPLDRALASAEQLRRWCILICIVATAVAVAVGGIFSYRITRPLKRLGEAARQISHGHMTARVTVITEDEIGDMTAAFNKMVEDVERYRQRIIGRSRELELMNQRLRELDQLKSEFLANVSHELRTPLNAIIGFTDLALKGKDATNISNRTWHFLDRVRTNALELIKLVERLLKLTRVEAGDMETTLSYFSLELFAEECFDQVRDNAAAKGIDLRAEIPEGFPQLHTDKELLREIIVNLLHNGVKFTREGEVVLRAELETETIGNPPDTVSRHYAILSVCDTGIGISREDLDKVFDAFRQVDGSISREHGGMGVGLAIVKRLTELIRADITVESTLGEGSTFIVRLPVDLAHWPA